MNEKYKISVTNNQKKKKRLHHETLRNQNTFWKLVKGASFLMTKYSLIGHLLVLFCGDGIWEDEPLVMMHNGIYTTNTSYLFNM